MYKHFRRRRGKRLFAVFVTVGIILALFLLTYFEFKVRPIVGSVATSRAKNLAVRVISSPLSIGSPPKKCLI